MATHKLGFLKINTSDDGFAFRFGDGKIHRFGRGERARAAARDTYDDGYAEDEGLEGAAFEEDDRVASSYSGRFAQPSGGSSYYEDDDYADENYDDRYADEDYADDGYADNGYYGSDDYGDDDGYADRYYEEDAADYGDEVDYGDENPLLRYIDENDWVTYVLLVLLPPLGIYLLWRRRRFEAPIRWAISAISGIWFVILLILLISAILSGFGDTTKNPPITMTTPTPTEEAAVTPGATNSLLDDVMGGADGGISTVGGIEDGPTAGTTDGIAPVETIDALAPDASATPIANANVGTTGSSGISGSTVLMTATGPYYHNNPNCTNLEAGAVTSNVTQDVAVQRGKTACPICYPGQESYYATATGKYYHVDQNCSNMNGATVITKEAAEERGQTPCPVCILHTVNTLDTNSLRFANSSTTDRSNIQVYATSGGRYFHVDSTCSNMTNATQMGLLQAMLAGKTACPTCASAAGTKVWFTQGGTNYHNRSNCSGMQGAYQATLAEALVLGKGRCPTCWGNTVSGFSGGGETAEEGNSGSSGGTVYVYGTENGQYYHTNPTCSGMTNAQRVPLRTMLQNRRSACPVCASGAETVVYGTESGQYYHSYATCSGMTNARAVTMAQAMAAGKQRCPECWNNTGSATVTSSGVSVYLPKEGEHYHTNPNCSGMTDATRVDLAEAVQRGYTACSTCASAANRSVYSAKNGEYYHIQSNCSNLQNGERRTLQEALLLGQSACPVCIRSRVAAAADAVSDVTSHAIPNVSTSSSGIVSSGTYRAGTSGVKVFATPSGKYYHTSSSHAGTGSVQVTLETALNYGKTACPTCTSLASRTVYAVRGGRYYHSSRTCAGSGAVSVKLDSALAYGLDACPVCVTRTKAPTITNTYTPGASGIKVYASLSGSYYHISRFDAGSGASRVSLETALNYGKTACPNCARAANITVYSSASDRYYHASRIHAGSNASSGRWVTALASGKKACPVCITGSEAYEQPDVNYSAPADTRVYIDTDSNRFYYHRSANCSEGGMSGGTGVALEFVLNWGFRACPFCNPPTSIG